jgi:hypothetical protein
MSRAGVYSAWHCLWRLFYGYDLAMPQRAVEKSTPVARLRPSSRYRRPAAGLTVKPVHYTENPYFMESIVKLIVSFRL